LPARLAGESKLLKSSKPHFGTAKILFGLFACRNVPFVQPKLAGVIHTWMVMSLLFRAPLWALCSEFGLLFQAEIHFVSRVGSSENFVPWDRKFFINSGQLNDRIFRPTLYGHLSRLTLPEYVYSRYIEGLGFQLHNVTH
jgi:hypothetical protein